MGVPNRDVDRLVVDNDKLREKVSELHGQLFAAERLAEKQERELQAYATVFSNIVAALEVPMGTPLDEAVIRVIAERDAALAQLSRERREPEGKR